MAAFLSLIDEPGLFMNTLRRHPTLSPVGAFLVQPSRRWIRRLRRPYVREAPPGFGLERLATAFVNNPGKANVKQTTCLN